MSNRKISNTTKILMEARKMIENPERWTIGSLRNTLPDGSIAYCARGAIIYAPSNKRKQWIYDFEPDRTLADAILMHADWKTCVAECLGITHKEVGQIAKEYRDSIVPMFNNTSTHEAVLYMFDKAIQLSIARDNANV